MSDAASTHGSGGAVTALALVAAHHGDVATLVAHEPPIIPVLPDAGAAERARAGVPAGSGVYPLVRMDRRRGRSIPSAGIRRGRMIAREVRHR